MTQVKYDPESGYISYIENEEINRIARVCEEIDAQWQHDHGNMIVLAVNQRPELLAALKRATNHLPFIEREAALETIAKAEAA